MRIDEQARSSVVVIQRHSPPRRFTDLQTGRAAIKYRRLSSKLVRARANMSGERYTTGVANVTLHNRETLSNSQCPITVRRELVRNACIEQNYRQIVLVACVTRDLFPYVEILSNRNAAMPMSAAPFYQSWLEFADDVSYDERIVETLQLPVFQPRCETNACPNESKTLPVVALESIRAAAAGKAAEVDKSLDANRGTRKIESKVPRGLAGFEIFRMLGRMLGFIPESAASSRFSSNRYARRRYERCE